MRRCDLAVTDLPFADGRFGYDIADYIGIDPLFGTTGDFDELMAAAHQGGLKVILDLVPNQTSDEHPWFIESRSGVMRFWLRKGVVRRSNRNVPVRR